MKNLIIIGLTLFAVSCTDAEISKITSLGSGADVKCYSGGVIIYDGRSTGKIRSEEHSDGYFFKDAKDGRLKEVSGNCVIQY